MRITRASTRSLRRRKREGVRTWYARGRNFIVAYSEVEAGAVLARQGQPDEYVLLQPDAGTSAEVKAGAETKQVDGYSLTFVPPGDSRIAIAKPGRIVRLFTPRSADLAAKCSNAAGFVAPGSAHPAPAGLADAA